MELERPTVHEAQMKERHFFRLKHSSHPFNWIVSTREATNRVVFPIATILLSTMICHAQAHPSSSADARTPSQYILLNFQTPNNTVRDFEEIDSTFGKMGDRRIAIGVGYILSYLEFTPAHVDSALKEVLALSLKHRLPVLIHLDGEQYWGNRPDLWNWWDAAKAGYNPGNKHNVEWHDWSADSAVKIGWRNWGDQRRTLPMPNLMSPPYRHACDSAMRRLVPMVRNWWIALPDSLKYLFVGINVGWESAIGVNNWYYPNGNALLNQPEANDPVYGINILAFPSRAVQAIGYAAVSTLGLARSGQLKAEHVAEVVRTHLEDLSRICHDLGIPREHLFTHCGGWGKGDPTSYAAVNKYSCPGWSFYDYAFDPTEDVNTMSALRTSEAPYWAATEWWYRGDRGKEEMDWFLAIANTISLPGIRYMCIYNWEAVRTNQGSVAAVRVATKFR
jgi:hypothetical protein